MEGIRFVREQSPGHLLRGLPPSSEKRHPGLRDPVAISWRLRALRSEPRGSRSTRPLYRGQGGALDTETPLRHQTQAQSCFSSSGLSPARPSSLLHLGGAGALAGVGGTGRSRRARRERAAEASTRSGGRERNPSTMSAAEPRSESSARHRGPGAG